jgi:soluble lytic murein transglycosylase-like protein
MVPEAFYKLSELPLIQKKLDAISQKYGTLIREASRLTNVPLELILSFAFIESGGDAMAVSKAGAVGIMQLQPQSATDMIHLEYSKERLSDEEKSVLRQTLKTRLDCIFKMKFMSHKLPCNNNTGAVVTKSDLFNPAFNILVGSIYLGILLDQHTEKGVVRLDKIVYRYNRGYFSKPKDYPIENIIASTNEETRGYILKLAGKNGLLDLIT